MKHVFKLHPQINNDCHTLGVLSLCLVLLYDGDAYPWFILIPERMNPDLTYIKELHHLKAPDQRAVFDDSMQMSRFLEATFQADKINIAALGNMVPQLHIHHVARFTTDNAWPAPIWGTDTGNRYQPEQIVAIQNQLIDFFGHDFTAATLNSTPLSS